MMIIGITGTLGAGKGTVAEYLVGKRGFDYFSVRNFLVEEVERRGLPVNRDTITETANDLRARHGAGHIAEQLLGRAQEARGNVVIESVRTLGEADYLKSRGALLWAVDADIRARYERIVKRASETDKVSFEKFVADERRETASDDPNKQNLSAVRDRADIVLTNNGNKEELYQQVEVALGKAVV